MTGETGVHAELYVRSLAPRGAVSREDGVIDRLSALADEGVVDDYAVRVTGAEIPATPAATETAFGAYLLDRLAVFHEWADRNDVSLSLATPRTVDSSITGVSRRTVRLPELMLAEYEGENLHFVTPCRHERAWSVGERLDRLASGETEVAVEPLPGAAATPPAATAREAVSVSRSETTEESESGSTDAPSRLRL
jgi:hypothetical protein